MNRFRLLSGFLPAVGLAAVSWPATEAVAQSALLDEGAFGLTVQGQEAGRETFSIRRTGSGADARILASGQVAFGGRRVDPVILETTASFQFLRYQARISGDQAAEVQVTGGQRLEVRVVSAAGERARELRVREGAVLLEEDVAFLHYFLGTLDQQGAVLPVIIPRGNNDQARLEVLSVARESVAVGGQQVAARLLRLSLDGVERRVWVEDRVERRLLRVEIPSTGYVAERLRPPA